MAFLLAVLCGAGLAVCGWAAAALPPPATTPNAKLLQAGAALQMWVDQRSAPWPERPAAEPPGFPREALAESIRTRWEAASPALRTAYAHLSYPQAFFSDQWLQVTGAMGTPRLDAYFAALTAPFSSALLASDGLRQVLGTPGVAPVTDEDRLVLDSAAVAIRDLVAALEASASANPMEPFSRALGEPLRLEQVRIVRGQGLAVVGTTFPAVRQGADLALCLAVVGGLAERSLPGAEGVAILLYEQGLPLLEVEFFTIGV